MDAGSSSATSDGDILKAGQQLNFISGAIKFK